MTVLAEVKHKEKTHSLVWASIDRLYLTALDKKDFKSHRIRMALPILVLLGALAVLIPAWIFLPEWGLGVVDFRDKVPPLQSFGAFVLVLLTLILCVLALAAVINDSCYDTEYFLKFKKALSKKQSLADYCYYGPAKDDSVIQNVLIDWKNLDQSKDYPEQNIAVFVEWFKNLSTQDQQKLLLESLEENGANKAAQNLQELLSKNGGSEDLKKDVRNKLRVVNGTLDEFEHKRKSNTAVIVNWHMNQNMLKALTD